MEHVEHEQDWAELQAECQTLAQDTPCAPDAAQVCGQGPSASRRKRLWGSFEDSGAHEEPPLRRSSRSIDPVSRSSDVRSQLPAPRHNAARAAGFSSRPTPPGSATLRLDDVPSWEAGRSAVLPPPPDFFESAHQTVRRWSAQHPRNPTQPQPRAAMERTREEMLAAAGLRGAGPSSVAPVTDADTATSLRDHKQRMPRDHAAQQDARASEQAISHRPWAAAAHPLFALPPPPYPRPDLPPPPPAAQSPARAAGQEPWRRARSARPGAAPGGPPRTGWGSLDVLDPMLPFTLMVDDFMPAFGPDDDDDEIEIEQEVESLFRSGLPPLPPPPPSFGFAQRTGPRTRTGAAADASEGDSAAAATRDDERGGADGRGARGGGSDRPRRERFVESFEGEEEISEMLSGALRRVRERAQARGLSMLPPSLSGGPGGWGAMYRAGGPFGPGGAGADRSASPGAMGRHMGGWAMFPPGLGMGGGMGISGMYGDLLAGAMRAGLPPQLLFSDRDFTADDYEILCRLDETVENRKGASQQEIDTIPTLVVTAVRITGKDAAGSTAGTKAQPTTSSDDSPATSDDSAGPATQPHMTAAAKAAPAEAAAAAGAPAAAAAATAVDECRPGTGRCTICLEDWEEGAVLRRMSCTHCFHKDCVDVWLRQRASCPICQRCMRSGSCE